jgi:hypothetical protein
MTYGSVVKASYGYFSTNKTQIDSFPSVCMQVYGQNLITSLASLRVRSLFTRKRLRKQKACWINKALQWPNTV